LVIRSGKQKNAVHKFVNGLVTQLAVGRVILELTQCIILPEHGIDIYHIFN